MSFLGLTNGEEIGGGQCSVYVDDDERKRNEWEEKHDVGNIDANLI
jgi:hypothetical protein